MTELVQVVAVVLVIALAAYSLPRSIDTVAKARKRAPKISSSVPLWYLGGQPGAPTPDHDDDGD